jgi:hypothetical protein
VLKIASLWHQLQFKMAALWQPCVENCLPLASITIQDGGPVVAFC